MLAWILARRLPLGLALLALTAGLGAMLVLGLGTGGPPANALLLSPPTPPAGGPTPERTAAARAPGAAAAPAATALTVYITGAVQRPGVYTLQSTARVADLLVAAGGPAPDADLARLNLAAHLQDGEQVICPRLGTPAPGDAAGPAGTPAGAGGARSGAGSKSPAGPVDINTADAAALQSLPGIGPALAGRILTYRDQHGVFRRIEDIQNVPGIGPKLLDRLRPYLTLGR
ncbi:MAG TPA: ComEA family DNA-binding protein [Chloroflexia bacterium]|nr:ComEA family DNA-binding protein [Chloroflexia bacterium]